MLFYRASIVRTQEIRHYESAEPQVWDVADDFSFSAVGAFFAHGGVIFYAAENTEQSLWFRP
jgi:hypothetical protein